MRKQANHADRKKEIVDTCLAQFLQNGLYKTSARDLGKALHMNSSALYYYFKDKDEIVVACAEEAGIRMENVLLLPVITTLGDEPQYTSVIKEKMAEAMPMMKFFAQVCTVSEYRETMQPVLERLKERHRAYAGQIAARFQCNADHVAPYLYNCVALVAGYMIFGEGFYFDEPIQHVVEAIRSFEHVHGSGPAERSYAGAAKF